jgi:hypothetical protein
MDSKSDAPGANDDASGLRDGTYLNNEPKRFPLLCFWLALLCW